MMQATQGALAAPCTAGTLGAAAAMGVDPLSRAPRRGISTSGFGGLPGGGSSSNTLPPSPASLMQRLDFRFTSSMGRST